MNLKRLLAAILLPALAYAAFLAVDIAQGQPSNQRILAQWVVTAHEFPIAAYGAKCDGSTNDSAAINLAEAAAAAAGGGMVTGTGICAISTALVYHDPRVTFNAKHFGDGSHDTGSNDNAWVLKWTGSAGATMMTISATTGAANQALYGAGMQGITFDCNNSAAIGLQLGSVKGAIWSGLYFIECTTAGLDTIPVTPLGEARDVQGNHFVGLHTRIVLSSGIGIRLRGISGANTSFDSFYDSQINYKNGTGIQQLNSDNVVFFNTQMSRAAGGSGLGVEVTGDGTFSSTTNSFYGLSPGAGGITLRGTPTLGASPVTNIQIIGYDSGNSPPAPTVEAGVTGFTYSWTDGRTTNLSGVNATLGESLSSLNQARTNIPSTASAYLYNGSQDGLQFDDGTGKWGLSQDGSHNLRFARLAGSGNVAVPGVALLLANFTVSTLPSCTSTNKGGMAYVTDQNGAPSYRGSLTGGGALVVPVFCNGSAWEAH